MVPPGGMSTSSAALRIASGSVPPCFSMAMGMTFCSRIEVWRQRLGIEELRRHRIDVAEEIDIRPEGLAQLVYLAVAGAVADQHLEAQARLARLAQEERDVRVVAGMQDDI